MIIKQVEILIIFINGIIMVLWSIILSVMCFDLILE